MGDAQFWAELPERLELHRQWQEVEAERLADELWAEMLEQMLESGNE